MTQLLAAGPPLGRCHPHAPSSHPWVPGGGRTCSPHSGSRTRASGSPTLAACARRPPAGKASAAPAVYPSQGQGWLWRLCSADLLPGQQERDFSRIQGKRRAVPAPRRLTPPLVPFEAARSRAFIARQTALGSILLWLSCPRWQRSESTLVKDRP